MDENVLPRSDHDTLIRLETKFDTFSTQYLLDIKELKDGTQKQLADHELRVTSIEKIHNQVSPVEALKHINELMEWKSNQESNKRLLIIFSSLIGSVIGFTLSILSIIFRVVRL